MAAGVAGAFFLDDPQDGASVHMLSELGVTLQRSGAAAAAIGARPDNVQAEHLAAVRITYSAKGTAFALDVRDAADAWLRIVVYDGDAVTVAPKTFRRVVVDAAAINKSAGGGAAAPAGGFTSGVFVDMALSGPDIDEKSLQCTQRITPRAAPVASSDISGVIVSFGEPAASSTGGGAEGTIILRYPLGSIEARKAAAISHWKTGGHVHTRNLVVDLCSSFYGLGWVTGTGGSISIRHGSRIFMAPSGVQKERMQPHDIFVLDTAGQEVYAPQPLPGKARLKLSQCAPLFAHAFTLRSAGACIHTHDIHAVMATLLAEKAGHGHEFVITHQEMIKGVLGHGYTDVLKVPIIANTPHECDLADSLEAAMRAYPRSNAVLVRRHGVYVWGPTWEAAKTQAECYHYLFEAACRMWDAGLDPAAVPAAVCGGGCGDVAMIGADTAYGTAGAGLGGKRKRVDEPEHSRYAGQRHAPTPGPAVAAAASSSAANGFHGSSSSSTLGVVVPAAGAAGNASSAPAVVAVAQALQRAAGKATSASSLLPWIKAVVLDIEGATTPLSFVTDVLFPYASAHVAAHLTSHWGEAETQADVAALAAQWQADVAAQLPGAADVPVQPATAYAEPADGIAAVVANVKWQMAANRKTGALKGLQGHIWRAGYADGKLVGQVFADVPHALASWTGDGRVRVYIYSSGSREAQRLLFSKSAVVHTGDDASGDGAVTKPSRGMDLRPYLCGFFDTSVGSKVEAKSYSEIAATLGVDSPGSILFLTDSLAEANAAAAAGWAVIVTDRPGNAPLAAGHGFPVIKSFQDVPL